MAAAFEDGALGLKLKGYSLVPNDAQKRRSRFTRPRSSSQSYRSTRSSSTAGCRACTPNTLARKNCATLKMTLSPALPFVYEEFEKHFKSWQDGGIIAITLPQDGVIRISKRPLISVVTDSKDSYLVCNKCMASFSDLHEFEKHCRSENEITPVNESN